jgi:uncharacterized protein
VTASGSDVERLAKDLARTRRQIAGAAAAALVERRPAGCVPVGARVPVAEAVSPDDQRAECRAAPAGGDSSRRASANIVVMTDESTPLTLPDDAPSAAELLMAVRSGDIDLLARLLSENPDLAKTRFERRGGTRTALHVVTDWPGYFPNGPHIVTLLIEAGADPNAATTPAPAETPLHWAASSDDVDVAAALIVGGAALETPGGSIGTPLDNAVGYSCWHVARLLVTRGARVEKLWHAGALGMLDRLDELLAPDTSPEQISQGFWHACAAGQRRAAERLLTAGADLNWEPDYAHGTALDAAAGLGTQRENVLEWLRTLGAHSAERAE